MFAVRKLKPGPSDLSLEEIGCPEPKPGEARVAVLGTGLCGSDLHFMEGTLPSRPPVTLGHEVAGIVDAVGSPQDERWVGLRVALETAVSCRICEWCRSGRPMLCTQRLSIGSGLDGGFASHLVVPIANLHALPARVSDRAAPLSEPLACVLNCLTDPPAIDVADDVVVIGPGAIGILAAQVVRAAGGQVTLVGTSADGERMEIARSIGLECRSFDEPADRAAIAGGASGRGVRVVVECSGAPAAAEWGFSLLRPGGRYVQIGLVAQPASIRLGDLLLRETPVRTGFASTAASWWRAMRLLDTGLIDVEPLVTEVLPLREWRTALARIQGREGIKTVLDPRLA